MIAFVAKYGKTPPNVSLNMPMTDLVAFANAIGEIMQEEADSVRTER